MAGPTHIRQLDGFVRGPLLNSVRPYEEQIRFSLNRLDGDSSWAYSLWRAPEGADLLDHIPFSDRYLQGAGSAEAMTLEVHLVDETGNPRHFVVGQSVPSFAAPAGEPSEVIRWDGRRRSTLVYSHEVFTADEAADVFYAYFLTDEVPDRYRLRSLDR